MNVQTLTMDPVTVQAKLKAYRGRKHKDAEQEYAAVITLLEAVGQGQRILNVADAIFNAPRDHKNRPMLAIARADRKDVCFRHNDFRGQYTFDCSLTQQTESLTKSFTRFGLPVARRGFATVPMVPADVRPKTGQLRDWHILFEVEQWHDHSMIDPPTDPLLLKHIQGDFYQILAEWDLTEIERAAMRMALSTN